MRGSGLLLALALAACASGNREPPPLTLQQARTLPPEELADIALRQMARQVRHVTRPDYDLQPVQGLPLTSLVLATAPRSGPSVGLCEATIITISFHDGPEPLRRDGDQPVRARAISTGLLYKVIGEVALPRWAEPAEIARQQSVCAALHPVIAAGTRNVGERSFFRFDGDLGPRYGIGIFQRMLAELREGRYADHRCVGYHACTDSAALLRALSFDDLLQLSLVRDPLDPTRYSATGSFRVSGEGNLLVTDEVTVEAFLEHPYPRTIQRLGATRVERLSLIRD
ncbi:MAG: hypothetical protein QOI38_2991 [Sphingomonadales bacterium]|jgi:hypothetical protein|nr:hypothetical protein [Sphingomonadales bacterium]